MRPSSLFSLAMIGAFSAATLVMPLRAQSGTSSASSDESHQAPPTLATGITAGTIRFAGGRTEYAMSVLLLYRPMPWLRLSTAPGVARMSFGNTTNSGLTDIPFSAAAVHGFGDATWSPSDSGAVLSRSLGAGFAYALSGPVTLTVDGSHGLTGSAPTWALSIGLGTAFAGISPLSPTSALKRLKSTLGSKTTATSGYSKTAGGARACKKAGTC